ncbi:TPA: hypothetical protein ACK3JW_002296 [Mannheimia haemolytica]
MQNNLAIFYCGTNGAGKTTLRNELEITLARAVLGSITPAPLEL